MDKHEENAVAREEGSRQPQVDPAVAEQVRVIAEEVGEQIALKMMQQVTDERKTPDGRFKLYSLDAEGAGRRFANDHRKVARHVTEWDTWIVWDRTRWKRDRGGRPGEPGKLVRRLANLTAGGIKGEIKFARNEDEEKAIRSFWKRYQSTAGKLSLLNEAAQLEEMSISSCELDQHDMLVTAANGIINLTTGDLLEHDPKYLLTRMTPYKYIKGKEAPMWTKFLNEKFADSKFRNWIQRAIGYTLTGNTGERKVFLGHGMSGGGKSTFGSATATAMGELATGGSVGLIMQRDFDDMTNKSLANHQHSRLVHMYETKQGAVLDDAALKRMASSDPLTTAPKYVQEFTFQPHFKVWCFSNHPPKVMAPDDDGIWERIRVIPFNVCLNSMNGNSPDRTFNERLLADADEMEAVLAFMVEGAVMWQTRGLDVDVPEQVVTGTTGYRTQCGSFKSFIEETFDLVPEAWIATAEIVELYEAYCERTGVAALRTAEITTQLVALGLAPRQETTGERRRGWLGLQRKADLTAGSSEAAEIGEAVCGFMGISAEKAEEAERALYERIRREVEEGVYEDYDEV